MHGLADFQSDKFYDISTQQRQLGLPCKLSEHNFENSTIGVVFERKLLKNFPDFVTSGRHNSAVVTNA